MTTIGTIYGNPDFGRVHRSLAAAAYNGVKVDVVKRSAATGDQQKPEYLEKFPHGKFPGFEATDGTLLSESRAIARFIAGISTNANLLGSDNKSAALIEQWIAFADAEIFDIAVQIYCLHKNWWPYNKALEEKFWAGLNRGFKTLDTHLKKHTYVASHRVTLADLTLASNIKSIYEMVAGEEFRSQYPNVARYYTNVSNQPPVIDLYKSANFLKENSKFVPPKKEEKAKKAPAPAAQPKAAAKPKKEEEHDDEDDEPKPVKPPAHPCASLPKSPFDLEEAKRQYSNLDTADFLKWFYEKFDKDGYSLWKFDFKYNDELTLVFMSANQIGGYFSRLEGSRKYVLGNGAVYGTNGDSVIAGVLICRGKEWQPVLDVAPDTESYEISPLDPFNNAEDKDFFEGNLKWEGNYKGKALADAKTLK